MTIRLTKTESSTHVTPDSARVVYRVTVEFKTEADANDIARAFETALLPRFTRDEAIAVVKEHTAGELHGAPAGSAYAAGLRDALEALAAAGVFSDCNPSVCPVPKLCAGDMADKLDAAGIR